jgi:hypothetical protein
MIAGGIVLITPIEIAKNRRIKVEGRATESMAGLDFLVK